MRQTLVLYRDDTRLIRTTSPDMLIDLSAGSYAVADDLRKQLSAIWAMDEYVGELTLEVING
jgi:hypothetical protein